MENDYSVILLSTAGDFLLEQESQLTEKDNGVEIEKPYIMTEEEKAQRIQADKVFIPYHSLDNIQYGKFKQETIE